MALACERIRAAVAEGRRICVELVQEFSEIEGVAGAHIMAPGSDAAIPKVIAAVRRTVTMAARAG